MRWLAIGGFDGVHRGHWEVLRRADLVLVIEKGGGLTPGRERCRYIPWPCHFLELEQVKGWPPERFLGYLRERFPRSGVVVGADFRFGADRRGDWQLLGRHFPIQVVPEVVVDRTPVHSREIRRLLQLGEVERGNRLLGRGYRVWGVVVPGQQLGGPVLGVPTLNLELRLPFLLPREGVHFGRVEGFPAVGFIGPRSTDRRPTFELHLLRWEGEFPGAGDRVEFQFLHFHRPPRAFHNLEELKRGIHRDLAAARAYFGGELE